MLPLARPSFDSGRCKLDNTSRHTALDPGATSPDIPITSRIFLASRKLKYTLTEISQTFITGPNGQVTVVYATSEASLTYSALAHLVQFDTSKTERLEIHYSNTPSRVLPYQTLLPMTKLCTLVLYRCSDLCTFVDALRPERSLQEPLVCPGLEELILDLSAEGGRFGIQSVVAVAAVRAQSGAGLKSVKIVGRLNAFVRKDVLESKGYVPQVECGPEVAELADGGGDGAGSG